jgi:hypothetical protein
VALTTVASFAASLVFSLVVLAALALLLVLAIPPIPSLRSALLRVQQTLADSVGDSYILLASPIQRAAIVSHVRRDLEWLLPRCRRIAVVAHSQGAAVAYDVLCTGVLEGRTRGDSLFITFGSGLSKLEEIRRIIGTRKRWFGWWPILGLAILAAALDLLDVVEVLPAVASDKVGGAIAAVFGGFLWLVGALESTRAKQFDADDFAPSTRFGVDLVWKDYYASRDPVPNGPLLDECPGYLDSVEVHNLGSMMADHTAYWSNRDGFVARIARDLGDFAGAPLGTLLPRDRDLVEVAASRRCWRVEWLVAARTAAWGVLIVLVGARWRDLDRLGAVVIERGGPIATLVGWLGPEGLSPEQLLESATARGLAGALLLGAATGLGYLVVYGLWRLWTFRDTQLLLERRSDPSDWAFWLFLVGLLVLLDAGIGIAFGWVDPYNSVTSRPLLMGPVIAGLLLALVVWGYRARRDGDVMRNYAASVLHSAVAMLMLAMPIVALMIGVVLSPRLEPGSLGAWLVYASVVGVSVALGFTIAGRLERGLWRAWPVTPIPRFTD